MYVDPGYQTDQMFGHTANDSLIGDDQWRTMGSEDVGMVIAAGIAGTAQNAIRAMVGGAVHSGQLQYSNTAVRQQNSTMNLLLIGAVIFFLVK